MIQHGAYQCAGDPAMAETRIHDHIIEHDHVNIAVVEKRCKRGTDRAVAMTRGKKHAGLR